MSHTGRLGESLLSEYEQAAMIERVAQRLLDDGLAMDIATAREIAQNSVRTLYDGDAGRQRANDVGGGTE